HGAVELPTSHDPSQDAFLLGHERHAPDEVGRKRMRHVKARIPALVPRQIERVLRNGNRVAAVRSEHLTGVVQILAVGVSQAVNPLAAEAPVEAHLQRVIKILRAVDAFTPQSCAEKTSVANILSFEGPGSVRTGLRRSAWRQYGGEAGESHRRR